jgi:thiosulfate/3-mercaptopyruvate sulfurtransferase
MTPESEKPVILRFEIRTSWTGFEGTGLNWALGLWLLKLYGHRDARLLDSLRGSWRAAGHPWSTSPPRITPGSYQLGDPVPRLRIDHMGVRVAIGDEGTTLLDVRSEAEFEGERFWPSGGTEPGGRACRIPSP